MKRIKLFEEFTSEGSSFGSTMKKQMIEWGETRNYIGKAEDVAALMADLSPEQKEWVDKISDTEVRVILVKEPDDAHELRAMIEDQHKLKAIDLNSAVTENEDPKKYVEITEDKFDTMLESMPPIFVSEMDGNKCEGFAVSEPNSTREGKPTFWTYVKMNGKHYKVHATLTDKSGKDITLASYNNMEYTKGNKAKSVY